jgi:acyl carrier protein
MDIQDLCSALEQNFSELKPGTLQGNSRLSDLIIWNSFNVLVIHMIVKDEYGLEVQWKDFKEMHTIEDLFNFIKKNKPQ